MSPLTRNPFIVSRFPVLQNAIKNILFRGATIILTFILYRFFAFLAFRKGDYSSFLMFAEDLIQKSIFVLSRKFNRQAILVTSFAGLTFAAGFYDTLLWSVDSPGYVIKSKAMNAGVLMNQMVETPSYIVFVSNPEHDLNKINLQNIFGTNLYSPGLNFTLPGIVDPGTPQPVAPLKPLSPFAVSPRIWLDSTGFAVGVDDTIMVAPDMNTTDFCAPFNVDPANPNTPVKSQGWSCSVRNTDALAIIQKPLGQPRYWWDANTPSDFLRPRRRDNPWLGLSTGTGTALMKQLFSMTKGLRKHMFLHTTFKATMISYAPMVFSDADVTDFMNRLWGTPTNQPVVRVLVDKMLQAQNNKTSYTFGIFEQQDEGTVASYSTEYLYITNSATGLPVFAVIRFASTVTKLVDSETLLNEPIPLASCNGSATNMGTGGVIHTLDCSPAPLGSTTPAQPQFLGQVDTTSVVIINDIFGDAAQSASAVALNQDGIDWYNARESHIEKLLTSRALIMGGRGSMVAIDVQTNEAAISYFQLVLILFPILLALIVWGVTFQKPMSYYQNSFVAAVFATAHVTGTTSDDESECRKVGYMRPPPEVMLKTKGGHVSLQTQDGELVIIPGGRRASMVIQPLIWPEDTHKALTVSEATMLLPDEVPPRDISTWPT